MRRWWHKDELIIFEELLSFVRYETKPDYAFLIALSLFRDDYPWIFYSGRDLLEVLRSEKSQKQKEADVRSFGSILTFTLKFDKRGDHTLPYEIVEKLMNQVYSMLSGGDSITYEES